MKTTPPGSFASAITLALSLLLLATCATSAGLEGFNLRSVGGADTVGGTALVLTGGLPEPGVRLQRLGEIGTAYLYSGRENEAEEIFDFVRDADTEAAQPWPTAQALISVGRGYARLGRIDAAAAVLDRARSQAGEIAAESARAAVLEAIIDAALIPSPSLTQVLQATIQEGYIIQDFALRVSFLLDVVERYREARLPGDLGTLIQQALPAASSIADPWERALAFARIARARRSQDGEPTETSTETLNRALGILSEAPPMEDATQALAARRLAAVLASMDAQIEAMNLIDDIPLDHFQALAYVDLARSYFAEDLRAVGFLMLTRGAGRAGRATTPARRAESHIAVARGYGEIDEDSLALFQLEQGRSNALEAESADRKVELLSEIVGIYLEQGRGDLIQTTVDALPGGIVPARLQIRLAEMHLQAGSRADAAAAFARARPEFQRTQEPAGEFALRIVRVATRLGETGEAVELAASLSDPALRIRALTEILRWDSGGEDLPPAAEARLEQLRTGE